MFALASLFNGLVNVQASIQASKRIIREADSKHTCSSDPYSSCVTRFSTISLLDDQLDEKKSLAESDEVKVTAYDGSSLMIPLHLFSLSKVIQAAKDTQEEEKEEETISLVDGLLEKVRFQNIRELMLFKKALSLIKDGNKKTMSSRLTIQQLSNFFSGCHLTKKEAFNLFSISEYLGIRQLNSALAHFLAPFIASIPLETSENIAHHIMREHLYATGRDATDVSNFLEDDGFLPTTMQLPATFNTINLQKQIKYLYDQLKGNPECNQLIQQLPPSMIKIFLIEKIIYANIDRIDKPDFDMMYWYLQLPPGRDTESPRERVLTTLRQKATEMVARAEQSATALQALKDTLAQLPEGWFTMELRRIYHERHRQLIDMVNINNIMERINAAGRRIDMQSMNLIMPLKNIIDLAIIRNEIHPITDLWLNRNRLTGQIPTNINALVNLKWLDLSRNQLIGSIPKSIVTLVNLKTFDLCFNQLTGSIPESFRNLSNLSELWLENNNLNITSETSVLINQLKTRAVNPVLVFY